MKIKNVKVYGLEESIRRSALPMLAGEPNKVEFMLEPSDIRRADKLAKAPTGSGHDNFMKGIIVQFDLQYPEYFSPQLQRYSWIDIISSQSKMHKITSRELTLADFTKHTWIGAIRHVNELVSLYNTPGISKEQKELTFNEIISVLPSGYLKWMGISTNYLQLKTIYKQRRNHKLEEWQDFCDWIETLPMSELIIGKN